MELGYASWEQRQDPFKCFHSELKLSLPNSDASRRDQSLPCQLSSPGSQLQPDSLKGYL